MEIMKILNLSVGTMIMRLHIMCAIMVTLGFLGFLYAGIIIGMLLFLATLMGVKFSDINPFKNKDKDAAWNEQHHPVHH
jgi:hypothetical protein